MKKYILNTIVLLFTTGLMAQGVYNNGAKIAVGTGAYLTISGANGNYLNESNGTNGSIDLNGKISLGGNFTNNVSGADVLTTAAVGSEVQFTGTTVQTIKGSTTVPVIFPNLSLNNNNGLVVSADIQVNGILTFANGLLDIGNHNLTFGATALVAGTPSSAQMIIASGSGKVRKLWSATGSFTFPMGEKTLTSSYLPVSLSFNSGNFAPGALTSVSMTNTMYTDPVITGSYLNRQWEVSQTGISSFTSNAVFQYLPSDVAGTESIINNLRVLPLPITVFNPANITLHQLSATALTEFGTFTGGVGNKTLNLNSIMLEGLYNGRGTMRQAWDGLGAHWPAGIVDRITVELHNASDYANIIYSATNVDLSTTGTSTISVPAIYNGSYYITLKHRNSLETTTASAISFAGNTITHSYGAPVTVFGGNLVQMLDLQYAIFGGDVNQDGAIDTGDMNPIENDSFNFMGGYLNSDINGDGVIDTGDMTSVINNSFNFVGTSHP